MAPGTQVTTERAGANRRSGLPLEFSYAGFTATSRHTRLPCLQETRQADGKARRPAMCRLWSHLPNRGRHSGHADRQSKAKLNVLTTGLQNHAEQRK